MSESWFRTDEEWLSDPFTPPHIRLQAEKSLQRKRRLQIRSQKRQARRARRKRKRRKTS